MAHILVIDDDDSVRETFKRFLERLGHVVSSASNGREGLYLFRQKKADIVITDIFMPEADGLEVLLEIRGKHGHADVPIIAMSGGMRTGSENPICFLKQAGLFGASRTFTKPIDFAGLHRAIQELLAAKAG